LTTPHKSSDADVRLLALDPRKSFLVEAPAGSGKTELLIQRYLCLLSLVAQPESIVALTFTRKAAAEMKERVLCALRAAIAREPVKNEYARLTRRLADDALARNEHQGWNIIEDSARLQIGTIDSFCGLLTRQMPLLARLGSTPAILEFADELYSLAARRSIVALAEHADFTPVFRDIASHFDGDLVRLQNLIASLLKKRDQWIRKLAQQSGDELRNDISQLLREEILRGIKAAHDIWPSEVPGRPDLSVDALEKWVSKADAFLYLGKKTLRKTVSHYETLAANPEFCEALHRCRRLVPPCLGDEQWRFISNFTIVLRIALEQLEAVFRERGEVDFTRISQAAVEALGPPDRPTELAYKLDFRIEHLLVDEFQDTSLGQYELIERLTAQWSFDDGRTLFLVGDPMQSIYRFRDAEVGLFIRAAEQGIGTIPLETLRLQNNFRSTRAIVNWIVDEFRTIAPPHDNAAIGAVKVRETQAARGTAGVSPRLHRFIDDDGSAEAAKVVKLAASSIARGRSTAILVRTRKHLTSILPALREADVPYEAVDLDALTSEQHILDLLSLTRAIHHVADRVAWIACLRAPFCGLTLADLAALLEGERDRTVLQLLLDDQHVARLSSDARERIYRIRDVLSSATDNFGRSPIRPLVEAAWVALGGPAALDGDSQREDAASFLALLESSDGGGRIPDFALFNERLDYLFARPSNNSGARVQVMTIHKAKGLEFDTVILPQLHGQSGNPDRDLLVWSTRLDADGTERFLVAGLPSTGTKDSPDSRYYNFVLKQAEERDKAEEARLFYVAATRAKEELHLLGSVKSTKDGDSVCAPAGFLKLLWPKEREFFETELQRQLARQPAQQTLALTAANVTVLRRLPASWRLPTPQPAVPWRPSYQIDTPSEREPTYEWVSETGRHVGNVVHDLLRRVAEEGLETWTAAKVAGLAVFAGRELERAGVPGSERAVALDHVLAAIRNTLESERGRWILSRHTGAQCEWALGGLLDRQLVNARIDRTFTDATGTRWIIDYKTSTHEGAGRELFLTEQKRRYQSQLELYARLLQETSDANVAVGLYFPLLDEWVSWEIPAHEPAIVALPDHIE
jgi:ATP-dependent helicase/nuclease subunit A